MFIAPADDLKEEIRGVRVIGQIADLIDRQDVRTSVGAQATLESACGVLSVQIEQQVGGGDKERGVAGQDRLVHEVLGEHRLAQALIPDQDDVLALGHEVEREGALDGRAVELLGPVPLEVGERFEATEARRAESAFESAPRPLVEFGVDERFQQDQRDSSVSGWRGRSGRSGSPPCRPS